MNGTDARFMEDLVQRFDQLDRYLLMLHYAEGLNVEEIAVILDRPVGEIQKRLEEIRHRTAAAVREHVHPAASDAG